MTLIFSKCSRVVCILPERKAAMPAAEYDERLENLLVAIAEKTEAIRAAGVRP